MRPQFAHVGAAALISLAICFTAVAGPLDPPAPPAPTINLAEPRIPIGAIPFVIDEPGSYLLTRDLVAAAPVSAGITVAASDVTIDLNGFRLSGESPGALDGIAASAEVRNVVIRNGVIANWEGNGVDLRDASRVTVEDVRFIGNDDRGVRAGRGAVVTSCQVSGSLLGIQVAEEGLVTLCQVSDGASSGISAGDRCIVTDCLITSVAGNGISFRSGCTISRNRIEAASNPFGATPGAIRTNSTGSDIEENHVTGSDVGLLIEAPGNIIRGNIVQGNQTNYGLIGGNEIEILLSEIPQAIPWPATVTLAGDLTGQVGAGGIGICSRDVTIDLNGHALIGVPGAGAGIYHLLDGGITPIENTVIRNGTLRDWPEGGVMLPEIAGTHSENLTVQGSGIEGINVGNEARVIGCTARDNSSSGIVTGVGAVVVDCIAEGNQLDGISVGDSSTVERCTGRFNVEAGILGGDNVTIRGCVGESNRFDNLIMGSIRPTGSPNNGHGIRVGDSSTVVDCSARMNDVMGIRALSGSSVINCSSSLNDQNGFQVTGTLIGCSAAENLGDGFRLFSGSRVSGCTAERNDGNGFSAISGGVQATDCRSHFNDGNGFNLGSDSQISRCESSTNAGHGILAASNCRITDNLCVDNGNGAPVGAGIRVSGRESVVDGNTTTSNDLGIEVTNTGNLITRNTSNANPTDNYSIVAGNNFGLVVTLIGSGGFASTDPWANFEF